MWSSWMHGAWGFGGIGLLVWLAVIVVVVLAARGILWRRQGTGQDGPARSETPLEILQKRYARGDLTKEEYHQKRRDLSS